jgi:hypothetical protein
MHGFPRFGRRFLRRLAGALLVGALVPAVTLAQSAASKQAAARQAAARQVAARQAAARADSIRQDSVRQDSVRQDSVRRDSAATHAAAGKRGRLGAFGRAALGKANSAANKVEEKTGVSKETMAQAALASTGVGAAAMLAKPGASGSVQAKVGAAVGRTVVDRMAQEHAAKAAAGATPPGMPAAYGAGMTPEQMAIYRQQMAMAQAAGAGNVGTMGGDAEMQRLQNEYMQLTMRASSGDSVALRQLMRFQQEMATIGLRLQGVAPDKQQAAYESALREALQCATAGRSCHAGKM